MKYLNKEDCGVLDSVSEVSGRVSNTNVTLEGTRPRPGVPVSLTVKGLSTRTTRLDDPFGPGPQRTGRLPSPRSHPRRAHQLSHTHVHIHTHTHTGSGVTCHVYVYTSG